MTREFMSAVLPMVYYHERLAPPKILCLGNYKNYDFFVLNLGTHPTAYVRVPKEHPFFGKDYEEVNHYFQNTQAEPFSTFNDTFSFSDTSANFAKYLNQPIPDGWYLGFDRAHVGDWVGYLSDEANERAANRKYTTPELAEDCMFVIDCLTEVTPASPDALALG